MQMKILIENRLRPCIVNTQKALFHCWEQHKSEETSCIFGIVEREDGTIHKAYPEEICFVDRMFAEYAFCESVKGKRDENG